VKIQEFGNTKYPYYHMVFMATIHEQVFSGVVSCQVREL
jgi:hypothetical protein